MVQQQIAVVLRIVFSSYGAAGARKTKRKIRQQAVQ